MRVGQHTGIFPVRIKNLEPQAKESECVESLQYDFEKEILTIVFVKRGTYTYYNFPPAEFENFNLASSRGTYFNLYIRNAGYEYERS